MELPHDFTKLNISHIDDFKLKLLKWADLFPVFTCLDSHQLSGPYGKYETVIAVDVLDTYLDEVSPNLIQNWTEAKFTMGFFSYEFLINDIHIKKPSIDFGLYFLYHPRYVFFLEGEYCYVNRNLFEFQYILDQIEAIKIGRFKKPTIHFYKEFEREDYIHHVEEIQEQIRQGDFYELNYCVEFSGEVNQMEANEVYHYLGQEAMSPMSSLFKLYEKYSLSFSPERFIAKRGNRLIAQPIKGTSKRHRQDEKKDILAKERLASSEKDKAENTMIVDLMRNDMTPYAKTGSIEVSELCEVYSYPFVFQMISTIKAVLASSHDSIKALFNSLPVGSMTGAPKIEVVKNIKKYESSQRGLYSGIIFFSEPNGDFDTSVVIRTLLYDSSTGIVSLKVGGAITLLSDKYEEYQECLLKAEGIINFFL